MTEIHLDLFPGARTPEGAQRLKKAIHDCSEVDYRCYELLRDLEMEGVLSHYNIAQHFIMRGDNKLDANTDAGEIVAMIKETLAARYQADAEVRKATSGQPE